MNDPLVNIDAEAELLGALMRENSLIDRAADTLAPDDFHDPVHSRIYSAILRQASLGKRADPVMLKGYFEADDGIKQLGGVGYLARLTGAATGLSTSQIAQQVSDLAMRRRIRAGLAVASDASADLEATIAEIVAHADAAVTTRHGDGVIELTAGEAVTALVKSFGDERHGVSCGSIASLDSLLGPMRPKQLIIGAGRPGMGKTAVALSYGLGAAQNGHGVLFVSLEMSATELAARMVADQCFDGRDGVQFGAIRDGTLNDWQYRRVVEAESRMQALPFKVIDTGSLTVGRLNMLIRRTARRMAAQGQKLELVIVDYLQLLSPDTKGRSNYEAVSEVSRALKAMAKDHGVAIFALAQLSREVEKRNGNRPQLSDLRDSGQIEQDADAVLFLVRLEYYLRQAESDYEGDRRPEWEQALQKVAGQIEFILAKRRNGVTGTAMGQFLGAYQAVRG